MRNRNPHSVTNRFPAMCRATMTAHLGDSPYVMVAPWDGSAPWRIGTAALPEYLATAAKCRCGKCLWCVVALTCRMAHLDVPVAVAGGDTVPTSTPSPSPITGEEVQFPALKEV